MKEIYIKTKTILSRLSGGRILYAALAIVGFLLITAASHDLYSIPREDADARAEYDELRELFYLLSTNSAADNDAVGTGLPAAELRVKPNAYSSSATPDAPVEIPAEPLERLARMNPDLVGWISVKDMIDYPIVQGKDNDLYLNTTFTGKNNPAGAIFMDYRHTRGFDEPVCVIYGHNMRDGSMFALLNDYIQPAFMAEHPHITITAAEGGTLLYQVFDAKLTDMRDTVHDPDALANAASAVVGDPSGSAGRYLILSTCTPGADKSERMLVYAALVG